MNKYLMPFVLLSLVMITIAGSVALFRKDNNNISKIDLEDKVKKLEDDKSTLIKSMKQLNYDLEFCNTKQGEYKFRLDMCLSAKGIVE